MVLMVKFMTLAIDKASISMLSLDAGNEAPPTDLKVPRSHGNILRVDVTMEMTTAGRKRNANQRVNTERSLTARKGKVGAGAKIENTDDLQKRATKGKHQLRGVAMKEVPAKTTRSVLPHTQNSHRGQRIRLQAASCNFWGNCYFWL